MATNTRDREQEIKDDLNPAFLFSLTHTQLLVAIAIGEIDAKEAAKQALAKRGLDISGKWVGFDNAKKQFIKQYNP